MSLIDETQEVIKFLEDAGKNGIISENAMHSRMSACNNLFGVLREGETNAEYVLKNLGLLVGRFKKKNTNVNKNTLKVYKSRVKSSVEDFMQWSRDPIGWEHAMMNKVSVAKPEAPAPVRPKTKSKRPVVSETKEISLPESKKNVRHLSLPIRSEFEIQMTIPADGLTADELIKLQLFLYPFCKDASGDSAPEWPALSTSRH
ncbi:MAG: hypothetical protein H6617_01000 [Bdellovibrionaceae bacterium]|nr:hypothetical protein [Bdellovibrionales bacterium]MCB9253244.1 hypothetical protein [Pseudobdellovibrionaceae bacterium]